MTHIENISHILKYGITHIHSPNANSNYISIGDDSLIHTRNEFLLNNGKKLGTYIPFYFCIFTPMLYVIQKGYNVSKIDPENIIYCVSSAQKIIDHDLDYIFTDGHAIESITSQYDSQFIQDIETLVDLKIVKDPIFKDLNDLDKKRRKQAEFLVEPDVPVEAILGFVVYSENAKNKLLPLGIEERSIQVRKHYYF
ncbi:DUF4433 domain-containing protein [Flavobacterium sp. DG2-3]|uniref:type II toxin-antitoxin system toxin DNA ADP-ribosyl transferase DarT n=1 Tax=Flavobacterium sp. DG2-3 TaxID=3068317 RepID=UPI00273DB9B3|nr:DUF4433 domain-containing protein [Flavobacterium sp. DG2-3]MDP5198475.1 DUF4433 domain-containing protein [Flavobacterium sp. DG2-3]